MDLKETVVLITGSTRNLGYGIAEHLVRKGASVYVNGRKDEDVERACARLNGQGPGRAFAAAGDLSRNESIESIFAKIEEQAGKLDILVNNACDLGLGYGFIDTPEAMVESVLGVNVKAMIYCSQNAARMMRDAGGGSIINISSTLSERPAYDRSLYCISKGAIDAATRAMAIELAAWNIRVNTIAPGYVRTERWDDLSGETVARRRKNIPLGMETGPEDIAEAVIFLSTEQSKIITGAWLPVDGAYHIQNLPRDIPT